MSISPFPVSSPVSSQSCQMWFEQVGRHLESATTIKSVKTDSAVVNYVEAGSICHINYTGLGGITSTLPRKCKVTSLIHVSDGSNIIITADSRTITIPTYRTEQTVQGAYFVY